MSEEKLCKSLKLEFSSFEFSNEKSNDTHSLTINNQIMMTNSGELDTNFITIIKEIERKSFNNMSSSSNSLLLGKTNHRIFREKTKLKKWGFTYILIFIFLSFIHMFNAINIFDLFYSKGLYFSNRIMLFGIVGLFVNVFWFLSNFIAGFGLFKKNSKYLLCVIYMLCFSLIGFIIDLIAFIYIVENSNLEKFGIIELIFLIMEGSFIVPFILGANFFQNKIEGIKKLKSLEIYT